MNTGTAFATREAVTGLYLSMLTMPMEAALGAAVAMRCAARHPVGDVIAFDGDVRISGDPAAPVLPFLIIAKVTDPGVVRSVTIFGRRVRTA